MTLRRLLLSVLALGVTAGPLWAQPPQDQLARRLTGSPQEFTQILAGKSPAPIPVTTFVGANAASLDKEIILQSQPAALLLSPILAKAADQVSGLQVTAAPRGALGGPAWWKVSDADSTVWIMGTPDIFPLSVQWDQRALAKHMQQARLLIVPGNIGTNVRTTSRLQQPAVLPKTSLAQRLPPELFSRLLLRADFNEGLGKNQTWRASYAPTKSGNGQFRFDTLSPLVAPLEFTTIQTVAQRLVQPLSLPGYSGNPARQAALNLAARRSLLVKTLPFSAVAFTGFRNTIAVPENLQMQCLAYALDILDQGQTPASLAESLDAWAQGDVEHALKRADPLNACPYGQVAADFWSRLVGENLVAVRNALALPGESVAIVEFDPLLAAGGLIDQLRVAGFTVVSPEGL